MREINLNNYEEVKTRIPKFFTKYPEGRITTVIIENSEDYSFVIIKAYLYRDREDQIADVPLTTGYAHEVKGEGYVNKTSHIENCETSAIGRALANLGLHGDNRPSREEMSKVKRMGGGDEKKKESVQVSLDDIAKRMEGKIKKNAVNTSSYYQQTINKINRATTKEEVGRIRNFLQNNKGLLTPQEAAELYDRLQNKFKGYFKK